MPDPLTAAGACDAADCYCRLRPELSTMAMLLRHGGGSRGWWRLVAVRQTPGELDDAYEDEVYRLRRGAVAVVFEGAVERTAVAGR